MLKLSVDLYQTVEEWCKYKWNTESFTDCMETVIRRNKLFKTLPVTFNPLIPKISLVILLTVC